MPVIFAIDSAERFDPLATIANWPNGKSLAAAHKRPTSPSVAGCLFNDQIQIHITPTHYLLFPNPEAPAAMTIAANATRPKSRGNVTIESADPSIASIEPNYLSEASDLETTIAGVRLAGVITQC